MKNLVIWPVEGNDNQSSKVTLKDQETNNLDNEMDMSWYGYDTFIPQERCSCKAKSESHQGFKYEIFNPFFGIIFIVKITTIEFNYFKVFQVYALAFV